VEPSPREGVYRRSSLFLPILAVGLLFWLLVETSGSGLAGTASPEGVTGGQTLWPEGGVPLCTAFLNQDRLEMVEDGAGGAIVVWQDYRDSSPMYSRIDLYARRVYSDGTPAWLTDGVPICLAPNSQWWPQIVGDGAGGAVITWWDFRSGEADIYAQRVLSDGLVAWTTDGISLCAETGDQYGPVLVTDGSNGAIVAWEDHRGASADIYAQRVYSDGTLAWTTDGISLSVAAGDQAWPAITSDGAGGAIVAWHGGCGSPGICAQRVHPDGSVAWTVGGVALSSGPGYYPQVAGDQAGGAIVVWQTGSAVDLYAQRVYSDGVVAWAAGGVPLSLAPGVQHFPVLASDGNGGAIVAWQDERIGSSSALIYAQRVRSSGLVAWAPNGIPVTEVGSSRLQWSPHIADDGQGGAIVTWQGWRGASAYPHIYAQQLHRSGAWLWGADGLAVCEVFEGAGQTRPRLVGSGIADAIITWEDNRRWFKEDELDVYAQRVRGITYRLYLPSIKRGH
jgi:hypothetical protein